MRKNKSCKWNLARKFVSHQLNTLLDYFGFKKKNYNFFDKIINEVPVNNFLIDYRQNLTFTILKSTRDEMVIESYELSLPHANSLRRILLGEIRTVAIEKVFFFHNSTILNDENIAHRLGLVPVSVGSEFLTKVNVGAHSKIEKLILEFKIKNPQESFKKMAIYSKSLKLKNYGLFFSMNKNSPVTPVFRDILILKLNPGQKIKCECHCIVDSGSKHAKFSPVGTAFYRISPRIKIVGEILGNYAEKINEICPVKVFNVKEKSKKYTNVLGVAYPKFCTLCKECLKIDDGAHRPIRISRVKHKISFIIESTGVASPEILFHRAISLLVGKCNRSLSILFKSYCA